MFNRDGLVYLFTGHVGERRYRRMHGATRPASPNAGYNTLTAAKCLTLPNHQVRASAEMATCYQLSCRLPTAHSALETSAPLLDIEDGQSGGVVHGAVLFTACCVYPWMLSFGLDVLVCGQYLTSCPIDRRNTVAAVSMSESMYSQSAH